MKKNILIGVLSLTTVASVVFAFYQQSLAVASRMKAIENEVLAKELSLQAVTAQRMAEDQRKMAEANAMEAVRQQQLAQEELRKCRGKK
jgi:hypothetical protein